VQDSDLLPDNFLDQLQFGKDKKDQPPEKLDRRIGGRKIISVKKNVFHI